MSTEPHGRALLASPHRAGLSAGTRVSLLLAFLCALIGLPLASQATLGVAFIGIACLFGIIARIAQAESHHRMLTERIAAEQ